MPVSSYMMNLALAGLSATSIGSAYQNPSRVAASISGATSGIYTVTPSNAFPIVAGLSVTIASGSLPAVLTGLTEVFIRPVPSTTGQFYCYATAANAIADTNRLVPSTSFTGTVLDRDLDVQTVLAAQQAYESSFAGYARGTANFAAGALPTTATLTRPFAYNLSNTSGTAASVSHVLAFVGANSIGIAKLPSVAVVPANDVLSITAQMAVGSL